MSYLVLRLPEELKQAAIAQAEASGISLNQYITTTLAARVGSQAEAERYFRARAKRATPGRAREVLARSGHNPPRKDDLQET